MMQKALRAKDYLAVSNRLLLLIEGKMLSIEERAARSSAARRAWSDENRLWKPLKAILENVRYMMDLKRGNDGQPPVTDAQLAEAIRAYIDNKMERPLAQAYADAISNVRETRIGLAKFKDFPPIDEKKRTA